MKVGNVWISRLSMTAVSGRLRKELVEILDHEVGPVVPQRGGVSVPRDADHQPEAPSLSRLHTGNGVLDDNGTSGLDAELPGRCQEHIGLRLPGQTLVCGCLTVNTGIEERVDPGRPENRRTVLAR